MREIKFRAWDKIGKRMGEVNYIKYSNVQYNQVSARFKQKGKTVDEWFNYGDKDGCDNIILMQYTGLKDKNGVEIYEGDILKCKVKDTANSTTNQVKYKFKNYKADWINSYYQCGYRVKNKSNTFLIKQATLDNTEAEVIGSIYTTPELLKEDK